MGKYGAGKLYSRDETRDILQRILDFIDHEKVAGTDGMVHDGHPFLYLLHTEQETKALLEDSLTGAEYSRYDVCYLARKLLKFAIGKYDIRTDVKLLPREMTMPVAVKIQDGKPYIVDTSNDLKRFLGWEITAINGVPVSQILAEIEEVTAYATDEWLKYKQETGLISPMISALPSFKGNLGYVVYDVGNGSDKDKIKTSLPNDYTLAGFNAAHNLSRNYTFEQLDDAVVIQYSLCRDEQRMNRLIADIKALAKKDNISKYVIDLRDNSGGNPRITDSLLGFLAGNQLVTLTNGRIYSCGATACAQLRNIGAYTIGTDIGSPLDHFSPSQKIAMDDVGLSITRCVDGYLRWDKDRKAYDRLSAKEFKAQYNAKNLPALTFFHPDETVELTVADIISGHDTQLEQALTHFSD